MSTYIRRTRNPSTGQFEDALWIDDFFGRHRYGVRFPSRPARTWAANSRQWEFDDTPDDKVPQRPERIDG